MTKLSELHSLLLATASRRADGSLLPAPATLADGGARLAKALAALARRGLAEERETAAAALTYREEGDRRVGLFVTAAGLTAIGVEPSVEAQDPAPILADPTPRSTKITLVLGLLTRDGGATLAELIAATGWLPHTTRAALTGLRKKGHSIVRGRRGAESCYRIAAEA